MTLPSGYFDNLYAQNADPWGLATRPYERRKYAITAAVLPRARYHRAFEPGCSIGALTEVLAPRCDELVATDTSEAALELARGRTAVANVEWSRIRVPEEWPEGTFDLIVVSELGYYFSPGDLDRFVERCTSSLEPGGHLVAVHWKPQVAEYPGRASTVHNAFDAARGLRTLAYYDDEHFLLNVFGIGGSASLIGPEDADASSR